jgi:hypothetical protein
MGPVDDSVTTDTKSQSHKVTLEVLRYICTKTSRVTFSATATMRLSATTHSALEVALSPYGRPGHRSEGSPTNVAWNTWGESAKFFRTTSVLGGRGEGKRESVRGTGGGEGKVGRCLCGEARGCVHSGCRLPPSLHRSIACIAGAKTLVVPKEFRRFSPRIPGNVCWRSLRSL